MLFNTLHFIFLFLPITLCFFFLIGTRSHKLAAAWLAIASLFFYGSWDYRFIPLLLGSISFNFWIGKAIYSSKTLKKQLLTTAIAINLALLTYYKYFNFLLSSFSYITNTYFDATVITLPIGISFFTFTQIAFLVDTYQGKVKEFRFVHYILFVTYFPHLIAGPVLHHGEMMPQFSRKDTYSLSTKNIAVGLSVFTLGLAKKVLFADNLAPLANNIFNSSSNPPLLDAWIGSLAYTMQLYFDFSGYSDMAIGLSIMFGVKLPLNFNSPYKSKNIIEFWRRWHMTLSRFLRDYLYIPLGGNRNGQWNRHKNLFITMLLGGLWHGAGWTYVIWGGLHGTYLVINHSWQSISQKKFPTFISKPFYRYLSYALTFVSVVIAWVFFRAADLHTALDVLNGMFGFNGFAPPKFNDYRLAVLALAFGIAWFMPNTQEIVSIEQAKIEHKSLKDRFNLMWHPNLGWLISLSVIFSFCILNINRASEFLYFQF